MATAKTRPEPEDAEFETGENQGSVADASTSPPAGELLTGRGRLVPALATGIEYPVEFGIQSPPGAPQHGRASKPTRWAKCRIRAAQKRIFPDGYYFFRTEEGAVHQLKVIGGVWHCLALAL
jgi:hypothetical protein